MTGLIPSPPSPVASASLSLSIVIVGGGVAGLTTAFCLGRSGHRVTIIEQAPWLEEVGAGIQLAPNVSRLLVRWGLGKALDEMGVRPEVASFNRYVDDERIGLNFIGERVEREHGAPYYHIHRADLVKMIHDLGKDYTTIKAGKVVEIRPGVGPVIVLESGDILTADMVIGADGIKSVVRKCIAGGEGADDVVPTGDMAYRAVVPRAQMESDENLRSLCEKAEVTCWMGPGRHVVGYFVRDKQLYNLVMIRPDDDAEESWTAPATNEEIRGSFRGWNSRVRKLTELADGAKKSKLVVRPPLQTWVDVSGRIALLGDSCHAMLPYLAQGAAMAIEDAAVLGRLFFGISDKSQIAELLKAYQDLRIPRATATQQASQANQGRFHLPDGPPQQGRDAAMKEAMRVTLLFAKGGEGDVGKGNQSVVLDHNRKLAALQFDYDAEAEADKWLHSRGRE